MATVAKKKSTTKKPERRSDRAKSDEAPIRQDALPTMEDEFEVPKPLQDAADKYRKALLVKSRATEDCTGKKTNLIEQMQEHHIDRVRVLTEGGGDEILVLEEKEVIKIEKPKKEKAE